jgi:hypothetical protein
MFEKSADPVLVGTSTRKDYDGFTIIWGKRVADSSSASS